MSSRSRIAAAVVAPVAALTLLGAATAGDRSQPAWFGPISAYYHGNRAVDANYDFASLYSARAAKHARNAR